MASFTNTHIRKVQWFPPPCNMHQYDNTATVSLSLPHRTVRLASPFGKRRLCNQRQLMRKTLIPWILLLEICWHGSDLDRLDYLGCSVACLQICCLALSWPKFQDIPSICRKWSFNLLEKVLQNCLQGVPLHNFLSTETFLSATWCGTFACSTKQGPNELKNRRTKVTDILHVVHFRPTGICNDELRILKRLWSAECAPCNCMLSWVSSY